MTTNFESLYEKYYSQVYNYIFYRIVDKENAEDIVADTFMKVLLKYDSYDNSKSSISTWIFTIARNTLIDYYRKEKPISYCGNVDTFEMLYDDNDDEIFTDEQDKQDEVLSVLKKMNELDRTIIALKYFSDLSYKQISDHFGYSQKHVGVILSRALKKFQKLYYKDKI